MTDYTLMLHDAIYEHDYETAMFAIENGADVNAPSEWGYSILDSVWDEKMLELLIKSGADVNSSQVYDGHILFCFIIHKSINLIKLVIEKGADLSALSSYQENFLHRAVNYGRYDVVKLLLEHGMDPNAEDGSQYEPPIIIAAQHGFVDILKLLIENNADVNILGRTQSTALVRAIIQNKTECVKLLLESGAKLHEGEGLYSGKNALCYAIIYSKPEIIKMIMSAYFETENYLENTQKIAKHIEGAIEYRFDHPRSGPAEKQKQDFAEILDLFSDAGFSQFSEKYGHLVEPKIFHNTEEIKVTELVVKLEVSDSDAIFG